MHSRSLVMNRSLPPRSHLINLLKTKADEFDLKLDYRAITNLEILEMYRILSLEDINLIARELVVFMLKELQAEGSRQPAFSLLEYVAASYEYGDYEEIDY